VGAMISKTLASFLEEQDLFVPSDDEDDDWNNFLCIFNIYFDAFGFISFFELIASNIHRNSQLWGDLLVMVVFPYVDTVPLIYRSLLRWVVALGRFQLFMHSLVTWVMQCFFFGASFAVFDGNDLFTLPKLQNIKFSWTWFCIIAGDWNHVQCHLTCNFTLLKFL
jgi:hypothetical protein